jgi:type VII secretion protein EccB
VSGWRFLLHRIEHALVRRDASMIDDPQRGHSTALSIGVALACVGVAGAAVLAFFKPAGVVGNSAIVADQNSGAVYVHVGDRLYPALNLTSARLIAGVSSNPVKVPSDELAKYPRGPWVGIPGAPGQMIGTANRDSSWAVCDRSETGSAVPLDPTTGLPTSTQPPVRTTAIGGPLTVDGEMSRPLAGNEARLLHNDTATWLVYRDSDGIYVRAAINLTSSAVTMALGIDATSPVIGASRGLISAIPEAPALTVPIIPNAGAEVTLSTGLSALIGSVLTVATADQGAAYYLVLQTGVVQISPVLAGMIRNADSQGQVSVSTVAPDVIAANLRPGSWPAAATYPDRPVHLVDPTTLAVTCYSWIRAGGDPAARAQLIVGRQLPLTSGEQATTVDLVTAPTSNGATADAAYLPRTTGRFVQVTGADATSPLRESLWWVSDSGIRYGIDTRADSGNGSDGVLNALALGTPVPAPWRIVSLFALGPTLSQRDARVQHAGIAPDGGAVGLTVGAPS